MPSNKNFETVKNLTEKLDKANAIYFTDYLGLDVVSITKLRKEFVSKDVEFTIAKNTFCLLYTSPSPRDRQKSRMPSSA